MSDEAAWVEAGLYDPAAPDAADRHELLEYLTSLGIGVDAMRRAAAERSLGSAAPDDLLEVGGPLTLAGLAEAASADPDFTRRLVLALGIALPAPDEPAFGDDEVAVVQALAPAVELVGEDALLGFTRVIAAALARMAEAADAMFVSVVEANLRGAGRPAALAQASRDGMAMLLGLPTLAGHLFPRQVAAAVHRSRLARPDARVETFRLAVGFADLVGWTPLSAGLSPAELGPAVADLEREAAERATAGGARLVKSMGDAVLIVGPDPVAVVDVLLDLAGAVHRHPVLTEVRGAVTYGDVVARDGDYFGTEVNVAARAVPVAAPGTVVVTDPVAAALAAAGRPAEPLGEADLKGIDVPVALLLAGSAVGVAD